MEPSSDSASSTSKTVSRPFFTFSANGNGSKKRKASESEESEEQFKIPEIPTKKKTTFIAVHLGAGKHSVKKEEDIKALCKKAVDGALRLLNKGHSADEAVAFATSLLEDSVFVNAGYGSNLTYDMTVECDAAFMNGNEYFGAVGAMPGVRNPVLVAKKLAEVHQETPLLPGGRVPPNFLVGTGAKSWAKSVGIPVCNDKKLISKKAKLKYNKHMSGIHKSEACNHVNDTAGAIALDQFGNVAATVSSGGNWLKFPGRIGHSPLFGCGCWASSTKTVGDPDSSVALSISGSGEILSKLRIAQSAGETLKKSDCNVSNLSSLLTKKLSEVHNPKGITVVGLIALQWDGFCGEFIWGHNSESFIVGYGGSSFKKVKVNLNRSSQCFGENILLEAIPFR